MPEPEQAGPTADSTGTHGDNAVTDPQWQSLRPRARLLRTFGDELISSETVAIVELVKNAYDADASRVLVQFHGPLERGKGRIDVIDDGNGMSLTTARTVWMEPATLSKRRNTRSERWGRRVLGEKGIGRFAVSRLANFLEVVTRRAGDSVESRVLFDWQQFDDEEKYLDQIQVLWEAVEPQELAPGGAIEALRTIDPEGGTSEPSPPVDELTHGTILRMSGLRTAWGEQQFKRLRIGLARLRSPLGVASRPGDAADFRILLELPAPFDDEPGEIGTPSTLDRPNYRLSGHVETSGRYSLTLQLREQAELSLQGRLVVVRDTEHPGGQLVRLAPDDARDALSVDEAVAPPRCGPFSIELRVWDRDPTSLRVLAQGQGSTIPDIRQDIDSIAGVNIYRDGFRVFPYGEPGNDWLELDRRRVNNPTLRLSNNQIAGYISITADANPQLRDQSNREGLIDGPALDDLRAAIVTLLAELEPRRYALRDRRDTGARGKPGGLFTGFDLADVTALIKERTPGDRTLLEAVGVKERELARRVKEVQDVLAQYLGLTTLGRLVDRLLHDGRSPLAAIRNAVVFARRTTAGAAAPDTDAVERLDSRMVTIDEQAAALKTLFDNLEPFSGRRRGRPVRVPLERLIAESFNVLAGALAADGVRVTLPAGETAVTLDPAEVREVIVNLAENSLHWLRQVARAEREIAVEVGRLADGGVEILFGDSGPGVPPEYREQIFDPYFSAKKNGTGLGLTIVGDIVKGYYGGTLELLDVGPLPGATFRITLQKRV